MRYLTFLVRSCMILVISTVTYAAGISWSQYSDNTLGQAKGSGSPTILYAKSSTCKWCRQMDKTTFKNSEVIAIINSHFRAIKLDIASNLDAASQLGIMELPTIVLFDKNGNKVQSIAGYVDGDSLLGSLKSLVSSDQEQSQ